MSYYNNDVILEQAARIEKLKEAITEIRDRIKDHAAYADLTEEEELEIGGDTAELSYLARLADASLADNNSGENNEN